MKNVLNRVLATLIFFCFLFGSAQAQKPMYLNLKGQPNIKDGFNQVVVNAYLVPVGATNPKIPLGSKLMADKRNTRWRITDVNKQNHIKQLLNSGKKLRLISGRVPKANVRANSPQGIVQFTKKELGKNNKGEYRILILKTGGGISQPQPEKELEIQIAYHNGNWQSPLERVTALEDGNVNTSWSKSGGAGHSVRVFLPNGGTAKRIEVYVKPGKTSWSSRFCIHQGSNWNAMDKWIEEPTSFGKCFKNAQLQGNKYVFTVNSKDRFIQLYDSKGGQIELTEIKVFGN